MKTQNDWKQEQRLLEAARALADFSNLEPEGVAGFRKQYPDFVPQSWWTGRAWNKDTGVHTPWIRERELLRAAWNPKSPFGPSQTLELVTCDLFWIAGALEAAGIAPDTPNPLLPFSLLGLHPELPGTSVRQIGQGSKLVVKTRTESGEEITTEKTANELQDKITNNPQRIWSYQEAVLFLHVNSWRVKICDWCKKRFIGEHVKAQFCNYGTTIVIERQEEPTTCYWAHRRTYKRKFQRDPDYKKENNARRRKRYRVDKEKNQRAKR